MVGTPVALMSLLLGINPVDSQVVGPVTPATLSANPAPLVLAAPVPAPIEQEPLHAPRLMGRESPQAQRSIYEPPPAPLVLVELGPVPAEEPPPAGIPGRGEGPPDSAGLAQADLTLTRLGLLPVRREEPLLMTLNRVALMRREEPGPGAAPADPAQNEDDDEDDLAGNDRESGRRAERHARRSGAWTPEQPRQRQHFEEPREPLKPGTCGGLAGAAFAVHGHLFSARWIERTLHGVIANHCQSKHYDDITSLDGGTVGISHFASGSLDTLYRLMDQHRYFGAHAGHVPARPYHLDWWREGMGRFMRSPEARAVQLRAWRTYISPSLAAALGHGWSTDRELAIAASVANSLGSGGFQRIAQQNRWEAERTLRSYARRTAHKERRRVRLNREFPTGGTGDYRPALASAHAGGDGAWTD